MILSKTRKIAYVHIPKCAGSMVKSQLMQIDETQGRYERIVPHETYGRVHTAHLPLWLSRDMYPEDFAALTACDVYTVVRDPFDRFQSAVAQRLKQFRDIDPFALGPAELRREVDEVIDFLARNPSDPRLEFVHFLRQRDFTHLDGEAVVQNIYRLDGVARLLRELEPKTGLSFVYSLKANQKMNFRLKALRSPVYAANTLIKKVLPTAVYSPLKTAASAVLTKPPDSFARTILGTPDYRRFIEDHYSADFDLHDGARA